MTSKPHTTFNTFTARERKRISALAADIRSSYRSRGVAAPQGVRALAQFVAERTNYTFDQVRADPLRIYADLLAQLQPCSQGQVAQPRNLNRLNRPLLDIARHWGENYRKAGSGCPRLMGLDGGSKAHWEFGDR